MVAVAELVVSAGKAKPLVLVVCLNDGERVYNAKIYAKKVHNATRDPPCQFWVSGNFLGSEYCGHG